MRNRIVRISGIFLLLLEAGCLPQPKTEVNPAFYYTSYQLYYNEVEQQSNVLAIFTANDRNGFRQILQGSATVSFLSKELEYNSQLTEYSSSLENYITEGTFVYTDEFGKEYINTVTNRFIGFPVGLDTIDVKNDLVIEWSGDPLGKNELVSLQLEDKALDIAELYQEDQEGSSSITIDKFTLARFGKGEIVLLLAREKIIDTLEDPGVGGEINSVYFTTKNVVFK